MYVVITTELIGGGRASRTCDLFDVEAEAMEFARCERADLRRANRGATIDVHHLDARSAVAAWSLTPYLSAKPTRKRGCRR